MIIFVVYVMIMAITYTSKEAGMAKINPEKIEGTQKAVLPHLSVEC